MTMQVNDPSFTHRIGATFKGGLMKTAWVGLPFQQSRLPKWLEGALPGLWEGREF